MTGRFRKLTVASTRRDTADAIVVGFMPESGFDFRPGQYLTLRADIDGSAEQRCYSICSPTGAPMIEVAIKRVPGGRFSEWAAASLAPGVEIDVLPPDGRFGVAPNPTAAPAYLAVAAGSGVTPILCLAETLLRDEPGSRFTLVYGNRAMASIMFRDALDDLKDRYLDRFALVHVLSGERHEAAVAQGRVDETNLRALADNGFIAPSAADAIFICGPGDFQDAAKAALQNLGAAAAAIQTERFLPTPGGTGAPTSAAQGSTAMKSTAADGALATVTAIVDGATRTFRMGANDASAVLAAERQGIELPSACRGGMCCTCRARVVSGAADMSVNYSLEQWELDAGFVLACQARPSTKTLTLDFDAV